jgi:hypothetical protein
MPDCEPWVQRVATSSGIHPTRDGKADRFVIGFEAVKALKQSANTT